MSTREISEFQKEIMKEVARWVREKKIIVPQKAIIKIMKEKGIKSYTTVNALNSLLKKGYIRRATIISNKTYYVQLRGI